MHGQGMGIIGMKLCGEGRFTQAEDREAAMKYVMNSGCVDAVTMGSKVRPGRQAICREPRHEGISLHASARARHTNGMARTNWFPR